MELSASHRRTIARLSLAVVLSTLSAVYATDHHDRAQAVYEKGVREIRAGRLARAVPLLQQAASLEPANAAFRIHLARTLIATGRYAEAVEMMKRHPTAASDNDALRLKSVLGEAYEAWADAELARSHHKAALDLYKKCLGIYLTVRPGKVGAIEDSMGSALVALGRYGEADRMFRSALVRERTRRNRMGESITLFNLGAMYAGLNRPDRARQNLEAAIAISKEIGDREGIAAANTGLGDMYARMGRFNDARKHLLRALPVAREIGKAKHLASVLHDLGYASFSIGRYPEALRELHEALSLERRIHDRGGEATTLLVLGNVHEQLDKTEQARTIYLDSLVIADELGIPGTQAGALTGLMSVSRKLEEPFLAIFYGKCAVNHIQSIRARMADLEQETQRAYLTSRSPAYRLLANLLIDEGRISEAEQVLSMLKQEEYFDYIGRDTRTAGAKTTRASLSPREAAMEKQYRAVVNDLTRIGNRRRELESQETLTTEQEAEIEKLNADLTAARWAYQRYLEALPTSFVKRPNESEQERIALIGQTEKLQSQLTTMSPGTVAVLTLVADERVCLIVVTPDTQVPRSVPIKRQDVNRLVANFRASLASPTLDPRPAAKALWNVVVAPILSDLEGARPNPETPLTVLWSLDGMLRYMPPSALWDGSRYACERWRNVMITLASGFEMNDVPVADWRVLALGVSKGYGDFTPLPSVRDELNTIVRPTDSEQGVLPGVIRLNEQFTVQSLRRDLRARWPVVHIASHFAFRPGTEADSGLLTGDGKMLTVETLRLDAGLRMEGVDLLTLSACDTAMGGDMADGKEVEGFGTIAQERGAKAVIASLWPVADATTAVLMREFYYRRQEKGISKAAALQEAQLALLKGKVRLASTRSRRGSPAQINNPPAAPPFRAPENAPYAHPYYWAPFILIGNSR